ncbi:MAG: hypothetical protein IJR17_02865 [Clostridia bacterium]|nr:hypothetical protein [Clostridia bacterium]
MKKKTPTVHKKRPAPIWLIRLREGLRELKIANFAAPSQSFDAGSTIVNALVGYSREVSDIIRRGNH